MNSDRSQPGEGVVVLREVTRADLPIIYEHQRDPIALAMAVFDTRDSERFMKHWGEVLADPMVIKSAVLCDGEFAGYIACFEKSGRWMIGYWLGREYWGRGIATRALQEFVGRVAQRPLCAFVAQSNTGSVRVLEKCGFVCIGEETVASSDGGDAVEEFVYSLPENQ